MGNNITEKAKYLGDLTGEDFFTVKAFVKYAQDQAKVLIAKNASVNREDIEDAKQYGNAVELYGEFAPMLKQSHALTNKIMITNIQYAEFDGNKYYIEGLCRTEHEPPFLAVITNINAQNDFALLPKITDQEKFSCQKIELALQNITYKDLKEENNRIKGRDRSSKGTYQNETDRIIDNDPALAKLLDDAWK